MKKGMVRALDPFTYVGNHVVAVIREFGAVALFFAQAVLAIFSYPFQFQKIIRQVFFIGFKSLVVITLVALFTGMVLGLQGYYTLVKFGSQGLLGAAVALSLIRELGPTLTAIMIIARAGSAMAAELGVMRISEQIDALDTMNIDPIRYLVSPKIAASLISFPLLTAFFDVIGIIGGYITGVILLGINSGAYFNRMETSVSMVDIQGGFIKALVFGVLVATICCYQGYFTHKRSQGYGAVGVSNSTTVAVVLSSVVVLIADYILTSFLL
ncbi:MAG: MlaE family ABC transporter permease [Desulfovibrionales bacterium]